MYLSQFHPRCPWAAILKNTLTACVLLSNCCPASGQLGELEFRVVDDKTSEPVAAKVTIRRSNGKIYRPRTQPSLDNGLLVNGKLVLKMPAGRYTFEVDRGIEYLDYSGHFDIQRAATDTAVARLQRFVDMQELGWWSGDMDFQYSPRDAATITLAQDLHFAALPSWSTQSAQTTSPPDSSYQTLAGQRFVGYATGADHRTGGTLLFHGAVQSPFAQLARDDETPSSATFLRDAQHTAIRHICAGQPAAWDLPMWVASGQLDSIVLLGDFIDDRLNTKTAASGYPRDPLLFPDPDGAARWAQTVYYHLLNCDVRLPPVAGSGQMTARSSAGRRVYVHCGTSLSPDVWWDNLERGRVVVTNGPILLPRANGELPGHVFRSDGGAPVELQITLTLHTKRRIEYLEIVQNGDSVHEVALAELVEKKGKLPPVVFAESGWVLIRGVTANPEHYEAVTSAPFYVNILDKPRISRTSAQFFVNWVERRLAVLEKLPDDQRREVIAFHEYARSFWQRKLEQATAE